MTEDIRASLSDSPGKESVDWTVEVRHRHRVDLDPGVLKDSDRTGEFMRETHLPVTGDSLPDIC